jgi:hypothetical protein
MAFIEPEEVKGHVYYRLREGRKVIQYIGNDAKLQVFLRDHPQIKYVSGKQVSGTSVSGTPEPEKGDGKHRVRGKNLSESHSGGSFSTNGVSGTSEKGFSGIVSGKQVSGIVEKNVVQLHLTPEQFGRMPGQLAAWNNDVRHVDYKFQDYEHYAIDRLFHAHEPRR